MGYNTATYGTITFNLLNLITSQVQATRKQKIGRTLVLNNVITDKQDLQLNITGRNSGNQAQMDTLRSDLQAIEDGLKHNYNDGVNSGDFILIPGTLSFNESEVEGLTRLTFTMTLIEDQFS